MDALLDGADGLLARTAAGIVLASNVIALLKARVQAVDEFARAIDHLDLDRTPVRLEAAS